MVPTWVLVLRCVLFVASPVVLAHALYVLVSGRGVPAQSLIETAIGIGLLVLSALGPRPGRVDA